MALRLAVLVVQFTIYCLVTIRIEPVYAYSGIQFAGLSLASGVIALMVLFAVAAALPTTVRRPSSGTLWCLASFLVVPTLVVSTTYPNFDTDTKVIAVATVLLGFFIAKAITQREPSPLAPRTVDRLAQREYVGMLSVIAIVAIATAFLGYGLSGFNLSFDTVYERRFEARAIANPYPGSGYLLSWLYSPLSSALVLVGLAWKRRYATAIGLVGLLVLFSLEGIKSVFVIPLIALSAAWAVTRGRRKDPQPFFGYAMTGLLLVPYLIAVVVPSTNLDYLITRRLGLTPGLLTHTYVDYAQEFGFTLFSQSYLKFFADPSERTSLGFRVGAWRNLGEGANANANAWAEGYASAGFVGVVLTAVLLALVLRWFDKLAVSRDRTIATGILVAATLTYVNGAFHTSLLSGGVLAAGLVVWLMPDPRVSSPPARAKDERRLRQVSSPPLAHGSTTYAPSARARNPSERTRPPEPPRRA